MVTLQIHDQCIVNGQAALPGSKVSVDEATAAVLLSMRRAVIAPEEPEVETEPQEEAPRPRTKARTTAQPTTPEKED